MSKSLGGWIHSFTVTDTVTHKNGYTVYKITSIVFPRAVPQALTCITVWKRFHEIKKLHRDLLKRHKSLQLRGHVPEPKDANCTNFFKRFDPEIIELRKSYILQLLDFAAQHPALYKSHSFSNFFENGRQTPLQRSPVHQLQQQEQSNIEAICDSLDLHYDHEINLIDPNKDKVIIEREQEQEQDISNEKPNEVQVELSSKDGIDDDKKDKSSEVTKICTNTTSNRTLVPTISFEGDDNDYIYEAAYEFSQAVQAEVNQEYRLAFEKYKSGVDKLLSGSKDDSNEERKFIAKAKVTKYMSRAEELYEKYLLNTEDNKKTVQLSVDITDSSKEIYLERPWNQLSKFKVLQTIDNAVMQVQDVTDKCVYIMKSIEKPSINSNTQIRSIFLPQDVPYMVQLLGFFQSDTSIYLLLRQAKGGKLFDHIRQYKPTGHITTSLNEIFTEITNTNENFSEISEKIEEISKIDDKIEKSNIQSNSLLNYDSGFVELLSEYKNDDKTLDSNDESGDDDDRVVEDKNSDLEQENEASQLDYIPSFDILSEDMDVNDLVSCSQKLLRSVSNTLEQFKETKIDNDELLQQIQLKIDDKNGTDVERNSKMSTIPLDAIEKSDQTQSVSIELPTVSKHSVLPEVSVKQWAKELVTAIHSLHEKGLILGDLRPDNLLLGSKGQLLLSYFYQSEGTDYNPRSCYANYSASENSYVAPERPLTIKSDWWSFGVILFELLTGYTFKLCHPGNLSCYYEIQYPDDVDISNAAKDLLNLTIQYNPENRLNYDGVKLHKFFEGTNWNDIARRGINSY